MIRTESKGKPVAADKPKPDDQEFMLLYDAAESSWALGRDLGITYESVERRAWQISARVETYPLSPKALATLRRIECAQGRKQWLPDPYQHTGQPARHYLNEPGVGKAAVVSINEWLTHKGLEPLIGREEYLGRGRPSSGKVVVSIRLDPAVIAKFKATGPGWQSRINDALKAAQVNQP